MTTKNESQANSVPATKASLFKVARAITLPLIKPAIDVPVYIKITDAMKVGKVIGDKDAAILCNCVNLETGEEAQVIIPSVLQGIFHDEFGAPLYGVKAKGEPTTMLEPALEGQEPDAYVGKGFMLTKHAKVSGKQYHNYSLSLLDLGE